MQKVIITGYTAKKEGVILETNIPARLKPNRMPSKETFVSWDKIGKMLFENYTELEGVASLDLIRNNSSLKKQYCMPDDVNTREEYEQYLKDIGHEKYIEELKDFKEKYEGKFILPKAPFEISQMFINHVGKKDFNMMISDGETLSEEFDSWLRSVCTVAI
jgi:hypothetical protein